MSDSILSALARVALLLLAAATWAPAARAQSLADGGGAPAEDEFTTLFAPGSPPSEAAEDAGSRPWWVPRNVGLALSHHGEVVGVFPQSADEEGRAAGTLFSRVDGGWGCERLPIGLGQVKGLKEFADLRVSARIDLAGVAPGVVALRGKSMKWRGRTPFMYGNGFALAYVKDSTGWHRQDFVGAQYYATAVELSADGDTLAVSHPQGNTHHDGNLDTVFVFRRQATGWKKVAALRPADWKDDDQFGATLDLSADGKALLASLDVSGGDAYLFKAQGAWPSQRLTHSAGPGGGTLTWGLAALQTDGGLLVGAEFPEHAFAACFVAGRPRTVRCAPVTGVKAQYGLPHGAQLSLTERGRLFLRDADGVESLDFVDGGWSARRIAGAFAGGLVVSRDGEHLALWSDEPTWRLELWREADGGWQPDPPLTCPLPDAGAAR